MPDLFDYITWRGDISFEAAEFNAVDSLVMARLSYIPFGGAVPESMEEAVPLQDAARAILASDKPLRDKDAELLSRLTCEKRYSGLLLRGWRERREESAQEQFAAVTIDSGGTRFLSFRGTDDSFVGWKEDFNMTFMLPVPSQLAALNYLCEAEAGAEKLMLGGHSKGGNLAVYASAYADERVKSKIAAIYNLDGPGFDERMLGYPGYAAVCDKIQTYVPQSSIIGMLFEHEEKYTIVHSTQSGVTQHDVYSWEVTRGGFVCLEHVTNGSMFLDRTLKAWVSGMSYDQRERFFDALYSILEATNARTVRELTVHKYETAKAMLSTYRSLDEDMRRNIGSTLTLLFSCARKNAMMIVPKRKGEKHERQV